jgi:polar amino acid transport system substrate-binding protein
MTGGHGADSVLVTAASPSDDAVSTAIEVARKRARLVVVGDVGMNLSRQPFYEKELELTIACSYGPGRYDAKYEKQGEDYPRAYVRWTAQRNMEALLELVASRAITVHDLITHRIPITQGVEVYNNLSGKGMRSLGIIITYPDAVSRQPSVQLRVAPKHQLGTDVVVGLIGAGNFAQSHIIPAMKHLRLKSVVTSTPATAMNVGRKFGFEEFSADARQVMRDPQVTTVVIATHHNTHAELASLAMQHGKHVFVEKPLATSFEELEQLADAYRSRKHDVFLMTGFNRRFAKPIQDIKAFFLGSNDPLSVMYRVNAGPLRKDHWLWEPKQGGRLVGEICHFVDLVAFFTDATPVSVYAQSVRHSRNDEDFAIQLKYSDGSMATVHYLTNGDTSLAKEYCEISSGGKIAVMDNFTKVSFHEGGRRKKGRYDGSKGHKEQFAHFVSVVEGRASPSVDFRCQHSVTLATLKARESLLTGKVYNLGT